MGSLDGVVAGDVKIRRRRVEIVLVPPRNPGETIGLARGCDPSVGDDLRFLERFGGPCPGIDVIGRAAGRDEVHRDHGELGRGATLDEEHLVVVIETQEFAHEFHGAVVDDVVLLRSVRGLHDRHPRAFPIGNLGLGALEGGKREGRGTGVEVPDSVHGILRQGWLSGGLMGEVFEDPNDDVSDPQHVFLG